MLVRVLAHDHPFTDGNKRTALYVLNVFCEVNGYSWTVPQGTAAQLMVDVAAGTIETGRLVEVIRSGLSSL